MTKPKRRKSLSSYEIYDVLREFQKYKLFPILDQNLSNWDRTTLETLSGVLYLAQAVFCKEV